MYQLTTIVSLILGNIKVIRLSLIIVKYNILFKKMLAY